MSTKHKLQTAYERWLVRADPSLQPELAAHADDSVALEDAFWRELSFGTGGLRGTIGAGPNRMNVHTVAKATQGLADWLNARSGSPSVAIARDSRHMGGEFCRTAAEVLAANGVRCFLYPRIEPTPALSFAVRHLSCTAGVCITASHNPAAYNGYKVYGADGCQVTTHDAGQIQAAIDAVDVFDGVRSMNFDEAVDAGLVSWIGDETLNAYVGACLDALPPLDAEAARLPLKVAYTPLHGAGLECVGECLRRLDVSTAVEPAQAVPDGAFPTCPRPNPEERAALELGLALAQREECDLLLATDPDSDRLAVAAKDGADYRLLTGNELGMLMCDFVVRTRAAAGQDARRQVVVTTVVSAPMADAMAADLGFELRRTLTGFKFIGEQIGLLQAAGREGDFALGFEESYGYLAGTHARDKDAVVAAALVCQMARWHRSRRMTLPDALAELYARYGFHSDGQVSVEYPGAEGARRMERILEELRSQPPTRVAGLAVERVIDYANGAPMPLCGGTESDTAQTLPAANVVELQLAGGAKAIVRPSGTEPKVKAYLFARGETRNEAEELLGRLREAALQLLA